MHRGPGSGKIWTVIIERIISGNEQYVKGKGREGGCCRDGWGSVPAIYFSYSDKSGPTFIKPAFFVCDMYVCMYVKSRMWDFLLFCCFSSL